MDVKRALLCLFLGQSLVTLMATIGWWLGANQAHGLSALGGGLAIILPCLVSAARVFSVPPDAPPKEIVGAFYRGEALKFLLAAVLLVIFLRFFDLLPLPLLTTYILAILVYWPALMVGAQMTSVRDSDEPRR